MNTEGFIKLGNYIQVYTLLNNRKAIFENMAFLISYYHLYSFSYYPYLD